MKFRNHFLLLSFVLFSSLSVLRGDDSSAGSIFELDSLWKTQDGKKINLSELSDSAIIASMVFLRCQYSCPITLRDLKQVEDEILKVPKPKRGKYKFVLISIDPENDQPSEMLKYMRSNNLDPNHWIIMTSKPDNIRELAAVLGFSYRKDDAMEFAHSMLTWVFDHKGNRKVEVKGRDKSSSEIVGQIKKIWKEMADQ